ncbi:DUF4129 domain-containing protein [Frondihabitans australicus]|uniref:Uncharacterized protein DUF4129 n=1 Tax=Frondihabitans australicus TaxID=386892 RepID=A0A495IJR4_9MICO|nr:DUF4129 domain-containing protein [Frondihabitans australicus]RKR76262.1 uncharacterized protein DUF4129 [Frondihabitans australicus]
MAEPTTERRAPVAVLVAGGLGVLIAVGAAVGGSLNFTGPRWLPGFHPTRAVITSTPMPQGSGTPTPKPPVTAVHVPNLGWIAIVLGVVLLAAIAYFVVRWLLNRRRRPDGTGGELQAVPDLESLPDDPSIETSMPYLRRGLERALDALDGGRRPTDAIVEAWLGLQEAAEDAGFQRQSAETPTEFTTRILRRVDVDPAALAELRRLYLGVRFGDHVATDDDVDTARSALLTLQRQWAATS